MSSNSRPKWWQVYLTLPLLAVLFVVDSRLRLSTRGHQIVQISIILLVYGLIYLWLKANAAALSRADRERYHGKVTVLRISPSQLPDSNMRGRTVLHLPDSGIKGVLSNTFEADYIDSESFTVDEVSQKFEKK